jgi:hypothetical protein
MQLKSPDQFLRNVIDINCAVMRTRIPTRLPLPSKMLDRIAGRPPQDDTPCTLIDPAETRGNTETLVDSPFVDISDCH